MKNYFQIDKMWKSNQHSSMSCMIHDNVSLGLIILLPLISPRCEGSAYRFCNIIMTTRRGKEHAFVENLTILFLSCSKLTHFLLVSNVDRTTLIPSCIYIVVLFFSSDITSDRLNHRLMEVSKALLSYSLFRWVLPDSDRRDRPRQWLTCAVSTGQVGPEKRVMYQTDWL